MLWLLPLAIALVGTLVLAILAIRVSREVPPTEQAIDGFGRRLRPALVRVREQNARTRARLPRD